MNLSLKELRQDLIINGFGLTTEKQKVWIMPISGDKIRYKQTCFLLFTFRTYIPYTFIALASSTRLGS